MFINAAFVILVVTTVQ